MSLQVPSLEEIILRIRADFSSRLTNEENLRRSDQEIYSCVLGGESHGLYGFIAWLSEQLFVDSCTEEFLYRHAAFWNVPRKDAVSASGTVTFTGTDGAVIPPGTLLQAPDGTQYQTDSEAVIDAQTSVSVISVEAGRLGNREAGETFNLVSPIPGVQSPVSADRMSGGADLEELEAWRSRVLYRKHHPPMGGAAHDYVAWALEVPGVTRAWCYPLEMGDGTVTVRFVRDGDGTGADIMPGEAEVKAVQDHIESVHPVTAHLFVVSPIPVPVNFEISGLSPDTPSIRQAVKAELTDLVTRTAVPGGMIFLSHPKHDSGRPRRCGLHTRFS